MSEQLITAEQASSDMLAAAAFIAQSVKNSDGHASAMKAVVPRYLSRGEVDLAAELANSVDDPFTRDDLLIQVAEKCASIGDDEYALQLADAVEDIGMQSQARERIAIQKARAGKFNEAFQVAEQVLNPDYIYAETVVEQAKALIDFEPTIERIEMPAARMQAYQEIAAWAREEGNAELVSMSLEQAASIADDIEHTEERVRSLVETASGFHDSGLNEKAIETWLAAKDEAEVLTNVHRDSFLAAAAIGLAKAGDLESADATLDLVKNKTQMASGLLGFSRLFWEKDEKDEARETLDEAYSIAISEKESEVRDSRASNQVFGLIAQQYAVFGNAERAAEVASENRDEGERANGFARIAQILTKDGDTTAAEQALNRIDDGSNHVFALIGVARVSAGSEAAATHLEQAADQTEDLPQLLLKISAFEEIAAAYRELGLPDKARGFDRRVLEIIPAIKSESDRAIALARLSDNYSSDSAFDETDKNLLSVILRAALY